MNKRKKGQTIIYKTLHRKQKIEYVTQTSLKITVNTGAPKGLAVPAPHVTIRRVTVK